MEFELLRIAIAVIGTGIGAWFDIFNRKNVPDMFLYAFLGVSLVINIIDYSAFIANLPLAALLIAALFLFYKFGQLGGADVIILAAIYSALPTITSPLLGAPTQVTGITAIPFAVGISLPSVLSILAIAAFLFFIVMCVKYIPFVASRIMKGKAKLQKTQIAQFAVIAVAYIFVLYTFLTSPLSTFIGTNYLVFLVAVMFFSCFFILFKDEVMSSMVRWRTVRDVEHEDALAIERIDSKIVDRYRIGRLVTADQLKRMKKLKIKWPVLDLPMFLPYLLIALVLYVLFGDPILYLVR
jgi:hypothetical protein